MRITLILTLALVPGLAFAGSGYTPPATAGGIGAQPVDATLTALAGGTCSADRLLYCSGADAVTSGTLTAAGRALLDDAAAGDQRTTLGLGALCTGANAGDVPYTPADGGDWGADPAEVEAALDQVALRVTDLEGGGGGGDAADITYTPTTVADWAGSADPGNVDDALNQLASRTTDLEVCAAADWADPCYGAPAVVLADWPDADDVGGADGICRDQTTPGRVRLRAALDSDCSTDYGSATRVGGVLRTIGAGDFRVGFRVGIAPKAWASIGGNHFAGVVYVDGADASTASWYGVATYVAAGNWTQWWFMNDAGAARWETYAAGYTQIHSRSWDVGDVVLERSGTTLNAYIGAATGPLVLAATFTVTAGAGLVGLRTAVESATADELDMELIAYRTGLSEVP